MVAMYAIFYIIWINLLLFYLKIRTRGFLGPLNTDPQTKLKVNNVADPILWLLRQFSTEIVIDCLMLTWICQLGSFCGHWIRICGKNPQIRNGRSNMAVKYNFSHSNSFRWIIALTFVECYSQLPNEYIIMNL